jgi:integrase/recombinase XerC/integrase/recombinase XerD
VTRQRPGQTKDKGEVSVAGASGAFLASRDLRPRSRAVYGTTLARLAADVGATTPLAHLEAGDITAFLDRHYGEAAAATWNLNRAALRSFFAFCARQGLIEGPDPSGSLEARVVRVDPDRRVIPARQLETLWRRGDIALRDKAFWRLAYDSAARAGELLGLDLADLDLDAKTAVVAGKGGIPRQVNWYTHTARLLARLTSGRTDGPLFLASRRPRAPVATADQDPATGRARLSYRRAAERFTETTGWTLHQLRHTRIRELKDQGCPLPVLQKITGHRSLRTLTEHYPGPSPEAVRAWYDESDPAARRRRGASG